jgi:hypothetical protein
MNASLTQSSDCIKGKTMSNYLHLPLPPPPSPVEVKPIQAREPRRVIIIGGDEPEHEAEGDSNDEGGFGEVVIIYL